ncbi:MAG: hypothetical protein E6Q97_16015 [Desulfurellales bacterium]|nr:MAG: hypothetical protein E6Q97_16015 [Desulfurellales bacterium]
MSDQIELVRLLVGDTTKDETDAYLLTDRQIRLLITESGGNTYSAAALCAEALAAKFAADTSASIGDVSVGGGVLYQQYTQLARKLRRQAALRTAAPYAGGLSKSDKRAVEDDDDRVTPSFGRDLHEVSSSANATGWRDTVEEE